MVADGHVLVVGQERVVGPEHLAHPRRVEQGRVEVRVVAHRRGQEHLHIGLGHEHRFGVRTRGHLRPVFAQ